MSTMALLVLHREILIKVFLPFTHRVVLFLETQIWLQVIFKSGVSIFDVAGTLQPISAGDTIVNSNNTSKSTQNNSLTKLKETRVSMATAYNKYHKLQLHYLPDRSMLTASRVVFYVL